MGISTGGLERQRPFRPIFAREINHNRPEAGDPQFPICNSQFAICNSLPTTRRPPTRAQPLLPRQSKFPCISGCLTQSRFGRQEGRKGSFPAHFSRLPAFQRVCSSQRVRQPDKHENFVKFLKILFAGGGPGWLNATLIIRVSPPVSHHASPPVRLPLPSRNAPPTLHPPLQDQSVFHRTFPRMLSF